MKGGQRSYVRGTRQGEANVSKSYINMIWKGGKPWVRVGGMPPLPKRNADSAKCNE